MRGSPTYIINVLIVTLLPDSDGLGLYHPIYIIILEDNIINYFDNVQN